MCIHRNKVKYVKYVTSPTQFDYQIYPPFLHNAMTVLPDNRYSLMEKLFHYQALCLKGSGLWKSATKSCNSCKYFLLQRSKEYAEILGSSMQGYSYLSSPTSPTVSLVSKAFWIKFSALVYGNPSSPPNAILPGVFLSEPWPLKTKHSEITAGLF